MGEPAKFVSIEGGVESPDSTVPVDVADESRPADQRLIDGWMSSRLRQALKELPPTSRMIIVMREMEGLSTREVAAIIGVSEANVKTRLHRARVMLRRHLGTRMTDALTSCRDILANISGYLDGELDRAACDAIERHAQGCPRCAALVDGLRETVGLCRQAGRVPFTGRCASAGA